MKVVSTI